MSSRLKLTDTVVSRLSSDRTTWYADSLVRCLFVAVGPTSRTFYVQGRIKGRPHVLKIKLGKYPGMTVSAARKAAGAFMGLMDAGQDPRRPAGAGTKPNLKILLEDYIDYRSKRGRLSPNTAAQYRQALRLHCTVWLEQDIASVSKPDVRTLHDKMADTPYIANQTLRVLRSLYKYAAGVLDLEVRDPTAGIDFFPERKREGVNDLGEWYRAVTSIDTRSRRYFHLLAALTGIRRRQLGSLRWEQVDFHKSTIRLGRTKSGTSPTLPISALARALLWDLHKRRESGWVFSARSKSGHIEEPKEKGFVARVHDARHIFTSAGTSCLLPEIVVARLRGDVTSRNAMHRYAHDIDEHSAVNKISAYLKEKWRSGADDSDGVTAGA